MKPKGTVDSRLDALERTMQAMLREQGRQPSRMAHTAPAPQMRLAVTASDTGGGAYPESGNTFPIIFLDGGFTESAGDQTPIYTLRQSLPAAEYAHDPADKYHLEGSVVFVVKHNGKYWIVGGRDGGEIKFRNDSGATIPAHGLMRITGSTVDGLITVAKPNDTFQRYYIANGPSPVDADEIGIGFNDITDVLYELTDGTPAYGESWGAEDNNWKLRRGMSGATIIGAQAGLAKVYLTTVDNLAAIITTSMTDLESGTVEVLQGDGGEEVLSGQTVTAFNDTGATLEVDDIVDLTWTNGVWYIDMPSNHGKVKVDSGDELAYLESQFANTDTYASSDDELIAFEDFDDGGDRKMRAFLTDFVSKVVTAVDEAGEEIEVVTSVSFNAETCELTFNTTTILARTPPP